MARDNYEERKQNRIERYNELADKNKKLSAQQSEDSRKMTTCIPMGQPILVGHHSEKRHRRLLDKSWNKMGQSVESGKKAEYYAEKAQAAENNTAISSDDPEALKKLKEKLAELEKLQKMMKDANRVIRSKKLTDDQKKEQLLEVGVKEKNIAELMDGSGKWYGAGFPSFSLTNNNAKIKNTKKRVQQLEAEKDQETTEFTKYGIRIVDNLEVNRLQFFFDGKPDDETRQKLKYHGFRWSPRLGCWQCYRSGNGKFNARFFLKWYGENKAE